MVQDGKTRRGASARQPINVGQKAMLRYVTAESLPYQLHCIFQRELTETAVLCKMLDSRQGEGHEFSDAVRCDGLSDRALVAGPSLNAP